MIDATQLTGLAVEAKRELLKTLLSLRDGPSTGLYPLSPGQQALWFVYQLAPASPAYNFLFAARLPGETDLDALTKAFQGLACRHPALRTRFFLKDGKPTQKVEPEAAIELPRFDAAEWPWERLLAHLEARADAPFDLERGPALRAEFYKRKDETVLLLVFHHIVADLWSMDLLIEELKDLYTVRKRGQEPALSLPRAGFADYLKQQLTTLHGPRGQKSLKYWLDELGGPLPVLALPTDRPRPAMQSYRGDTYTWQIPGETVAKLRGLAGELGATLFPILLGAFELLLHRYSGQADLLVGVTTADRGKPEWERLVGYFLNQIVLRARLQPEMTFLDLVGQVREKLYAGLEHQDYPFAELVKKLHPHRDPSRSPVFQTMFIWDRPRALAFPSSIDLSRPVSANGTLKLEPVLLEQRGAPCDLSFIVFEGDVLTARFCYNTDLFERTTVERMARHLDALLAAVADAPRAALRDVSMLPEAERRQVLAWGQPPAQEASDDSWLSRFERQAPEAVAVEQDDRRLTYGELNALANQMARVLERNGVAPGGLVALHLPRCPELFALVLAAWKLRAAYVYLDPTYPAQRLAGMLDDARPALLVTATEAPSPSVKSLSLRSLLASVVGVEATNLGHTPRADDWAYVIYTSGSTGKPKGTVLTHRGLLPLCQAQRSFLGVGPSDRVLQFASLSFDASVWEMVMAFGSGARLVVPSGNVLPGPGLAQLLRDRQVTLVTLPPSILAAMPQEEYPDLRRIVVAGEACPAELVARWAPGRRMVNAYGPTEATVCAAWSECVPDQGAPPIGRPMAGSTIRIVDAEGQLVPIGVPGELLIGGSGVALGYLNQPGPTAERFQPDAYSDDAVVYRSGDLARWRADGQVEFLGRLDHQVKLRGHRIELDEIQEVLRLHPGVADAAVLLREEANKPPGLAAYLVPKKAGELPLDSIREYLKARLPGYMVPASLTPLERMPLTGYGKIDRRALARIAPVVQGAKRHTPARTEAEKTLAQIWGRVLGLDTVGIHDNFFDLGGASIQTVEVVSLAGQAGLSLTPEMIFRHQTIAELAERCSAAVSQTTQAVAQEHAQGAARLTGPGALIESLGVYLPPKVLTTEEVLKGCKIALDFPLERFTGIKSRRVAGEEEFSIDLARKALADCLSRSKYAADEIDLLICCNISRYDGPFFRFSLEPTTAARLQQEFGLVHAMAFDLTNACAGTFTAISLADAMLRQGVVRNALIVTGEYITHLTRTAQMEIEDFMDARMACLTLGDAGQAILLERAPTADVGFHDIELFTLGRYHPLCVAKVTRDSHGGAIMHTDPVKSAVVTTKLAVGHCLEVLERNRWKPEAVRQLIMHQTSERTLDGAVQEINRVLGKTAVDRRNTVYNLAERGNCATNTHMLAVAENIKSGRIQDGDRVLFAVSGSGLVVGTAIYTFDDLPSRTREEGAKRRSKSEATGKRLRAVTFEKPVRIEAVGGRAKKADSIAMLREAGEDCLRQSRVARNDLDLVIHSGVYHTDFLSEPALATIAAGELGINHDDESNFPRRTFAFDLLNGGAGTLTAVFVGASQMQAERVARVLVLASEVENNEETWPDHRLGVEPTATAFILERSQKEGFYAFGFRAFPEHLEKRASWTGAHDYKPAAFHQTDPALDAVYLDCVAVAVGEFLAEHGLTLADVGVVLPPWRSAEFTASLASRLGVPLAKVVTRSDRGGDLFTSSLACVFAATREQKRLAEDAVALVIEVGAGVQVACALYRG